MTRLDIIAAWIAFALQFTVVAIAAFQVAGYGWFTDQNALRAIAAISVIANLFEPWVKKGQALYDQIQATRK